MEFKDRAPNTTITGSYFQGTGNDIATVDFCNGGYFKITNSILSRTAPPSNNYTTDGGFIRYGYEESGNPQPDQAQRTDSVDIENNTFQTWTYNYPASSGTEPWYAMGFYYPETSPPASSTIQDNAFVGFCPTGNPPLDYHGNYAAAFAPSEISASFVLSNKQNGVVNPTGQMTYWHQSGTIARAAATVGAED